MAKDLSNKKFGYLVPKKVIGRKNGSLLWECKCICGNMTNVRSNKLSQGHTKSCGCLKQKIKSESLKRFHEKNFNPLNRSACWRGYGEIGLTYFHSIAYGAKTRKLQFSVSIKYIWRLFLKQKRKCALTGLKITPFHNKKNQNIGNASLDRIDSSKGYVKGNVQWVHKDVNVMKMGFSEQYFIKLCKLIAKNK